MPVLGQQLGPVGASRIGRETLGFRSGQMTSRVWLLEEGHRKRRKHRLTPGSLLFSAEGLLFLPDHFAVVPTYLAPQPLASTIHPHPNQSITLLELGVLAFAQSSH